MMVASTMPLVLGAPVPGPVPPTSFTKVTGDALVMGPSGGFGCAWGDYDKDGYIDLFVANAYNQKNFLYRNRGDGTFAKVITGQIVNDSSDGAGAVWGDYDNDSYLDMFVPQAFSPSKDLLYRGGGDGSFAKILGRLPANDDVFGQGALWLDYDRDGHLDLLVGNSGRPFLYRNLGDGTFVQIKTGSPVNKDYAVWGMAMADINNDGWPDFVLANDGPCNLFQNTVWSQGDAPFLVGELTDYSGFARKLTNATPDAVSGYVWSQLPADLQLELQTPGTVTIQRRTRLVEGLNGILGGGSIYDPARFLNVPLSVDLRSLIGSNPTGKALFRMNRTLLEETYSKELTREQFQEVKGMPALFSQSGANRGVAFADFDNDGDQDLVTSGGGRNRLYRNRGDGTFEAVQGDPVVTTTGVFMGVAWGDYDNDGWLDLFCSGFGNKNRLYHNNGDGTFTQVTEGDITTEGGRSYACAWGDIDNDGALDLFVVGGSGNPNNAANGQSLLYRNQGNPNGWVTLKLVGSVSNHSAIGARVSLLATIAGKELWQTREVSGGSGMFGQNDLRVHFGLGDAAQIDLVRIQWPSGFVQEIQRPELKKIHTIVESPRLRSVSRSAGQFQILGAKDVDYELQASPDMKTWNRIGNAKGGVEISDPDAAGSNGRYYRLLVQP
jgi:hypothetical protein